MNEVFVIFVNGKPVGACPTLAVALASLSQTYSNCECVGFQKWKIGGSIDEAKIEKVEYSATITHF